MPAKVCLNMIVKNESGRILRALKSAAPYISSFVIVDTGSTDDTISMINEFFAQEKIPGRIYTAPFENWSQARNAALARARMQLGAFDWDWLLLMDADMELVVDNRIAWEMLLDNAAKAKSLDMEQRTGSLHYLNRRLMHKDAPGFYIGVTHEYLDVPAGGQVPNAVAHFKDHADGANRPDKYQRDVRLLLEGLKEEPKNGRYYYYLAQSYRDGNDLDNAIKWYKKRVEFGGWIEEQWSAQVNLAHCLKAKGDEAGFVMEMLKAYAMRPSRAESLYDLAQHFRHQDGKQNVASLFAEVGLDIPRSNDALFVNDYAYDTGLKEEFAITGFYNEGKRKKAAKVCDWLSLNTGPYPQGRATGRQNLYWYIKPLKEHAPSFQTKRIDFTPPEHWTAMNPSVTLYRDQLYAVVRTVNYRINEHGQYLIRANDGTANNTNPIETRNWLLHIGLDLNSKPDAEEILPPSPPMACEFPPVIGFEDMRIFEWKEQLHFSSCVRQVHWDGNCEQVRGRIWRRVSDFAPEVTDWRRMLKEPRETEKNWAPIVDGPDLKFMWRPGTVVDNEGKVIFHSPPPITTDIVSGGSQLVKFDTGWVALVHTAHQLPNSPCRYYYHRWAYYDRDFRLLKLSAPFVFEDRVIEFAAGLCWHPAPSAVAHGRKLVISYGFKDEEAKIATIDEADVARMLWANP
jgi:tetratricopeptide (TPR) repeat protein